jgi:hypothetical protein
LIHAAQLLVHSAEIGYARKPQILAVILEW